MSTPSPRPDSLSLEQQRKLAKDLLRAARSGAASALARIRAVRSDAADPSRPLQLADAQLAIARDAGAESWPKLVAALQEHDVQAFSRAVEQGDVPRVKALLAAPHVRRRINDAMFAFGQRAAHIAARNEAMLAVLLDAGADLHLKSEWEPGPYTVLDNADERTAGYLLARGAALTPHVAARLGWDDDLRRLVDADPSLVHARGGDGQQPLHQAKTVGIADFLLDRGAGIDVPCIDHRSTPAQYAVADRPDVCRRLLERGATPDIFMAARLGDAALAARLVDVDPACVSARINQPGYGPVPPMHIYCWTLGFGLSPHDVALQAGHRDVYDLLTSRSPALVRLLNAFVADDERAARALLAEHPTLIASLGRREHGYLAHAIFQSRFAAARLMLDLGFDPSAPGVDGGNALHSACWVGHAPLVERLLAHGSIPVDARDATHGSTPLGWTAFGSVHRRAAGADYPAVVDLLVAAGADITAPGNRHRASYLEMAAGNSTVQEALRRHGAR